MKRHSGILLTLALLFILPAAVHASAFESGTASWYGGKFQGRKTANGEIFDTNKLTAAHKTLPFNTVVKVTNLQNSKAVTVRINDRGPFVAGRVIDLSYAAAEVLEMTLAGVADVKIEIVSLPEGCTEAALKKSEAVHPEGIPESYKIQIASFAQSANAETCLRKVKAAGINAEIEKSSTGMLRIIVPAVKKEEIEPIKGLLSEIGFTSPLVRHN